MFPSRFLARHLPLMLLAVLAAALIAACGDSAADDGEGLSPGASIDERWPVLPDGAEAMGLGIEDLEDAYAAAVTGATAHEGTVDGVEASRAAAELARILALRAPEAEADHLDAARDHLITAARRKALAGACDAALDLARLYARDRREPEEAFLVAYRTARRFDAESHGACVIEARRITVTLDHHRPGPGRLAVIDADPDADDPSADLVGRGAGAIAGAAVEGGDGDWVDFAPAGEGGVALPGATLTGVGVYGGAVADAPASNIVRIVLRFDGPAAYRQGELPEDAGLPARLYVDFRGASLGTDVARAQPVGAARVTRLRVAPFEPGVTRVVFDLDGEVRSRLFVLSDPFRVVVDFDSSPTAPANAPRRADVIVLDAGHGGNEFGARYGGLKESDLTLDLAQRVRAVLGRRLPQSRILMARERDEVVSLEERAAYANAVGADLFVSIHLNAADDPVERGGVATFVLDTTNDRQARRLAARENGTRSGGVTDLARTLAGLHREGQNAESRRLAALVQRGTLIGGRTVLPDLPDRGVKSAMFYVLVGARMPAILLEASFLTQPDENRALATDAYRQALSEGVAEGVVRYVRGDPAPID
ncbi:MAG: N-acetylmuramoyl-L-alanine amidase [Deltaproteobacteria bacterium]|nr:N-acetylmuramoyl-L-alanine amidase [Deltaproteobacteria bacterium]